LSDFVFFFIDSVILFLLIVHVRLAERPRQSRLSKNSSPPKLDPHMTQPISLQDRFYPMRTSLLAFSFLKPMATTLSLSHSLLTFFQNIMV